MNPLALFYMAQFEADKKEREFQEDVKEVSFSPLLEQHVIRHRG